MRQDEVLFESAIEAIHADRPTSDQLSASADRVAERLGLDHGVHAPSSVLVTCEDVRRRFLSRDAGVVPDSTLRLIDAHLLECQACRLRFQAGSAATAVRWSAPKTVRIDAWRPRTFGWALATAATFLLAGLFVYRAYWQVPPGVRAEVESIDGSAYLISNNGDRQLAPGDKLSQDQRLRTSGGGHAVLRLSDGSTVEMNERSVLAIGARGVNTTIALDDGDVIVQAVKRTSGHLYVKTPDCRVAVTGTVFSVDSGLKGSRVAVLQGAVDVSHGGIDSVVHAGDQVSTSSALAPAPVEQQIAWSHDREKYLPLLAELGVLQHRIAQIPFPEPRYTSDLVGKVPADTLLYISIPNLGDFVAQANQIFHEELKQSPELQQWWNQGHEKNTADLDALVDKIHQVSTYLGNEIVVVGVKQAGHPVFAIVADVKQAGLEDLLKNQFPVSGSMKGLTVLDKNSLNSVPAEEKNGGFAVIAGNHIVLSNDVAALKLVNRQLNSGDSGFAQADFGKQIAGAYSRGAGIFLAADLHEMIGAKAMLVHGGARAESAVNTSGLDQVQYLIAEHREINGQPENQVKLQFSGARQGVASWLAAPAAIGSLQFVSPNAAAAVAVLSKDPKTIVDDILNMAVPDKEMQNKDRADMQANLQLDLREDVAASLGGDFTVALDGPVLPTPSWKAVIEVNDSARLEQTLEHLAALSNNFANGQHPHHISIDSTTVDGQRYYSVHDSGTGTVVAQYTFADGYMVVAPDRALLMESLKIYASGDSLARSTSFISLLPKDANENYSAIAYQNLTPVLTPLLGQMSGKAADALRQMAADAKPTAVCVRGEEDSIVAATDSRLFNVDFLTIETLLGFGNKNPKFVVKN